MKARDAVFFPDAGPPVLHWLARPIHNRMPVILDKADIRTWLNGSAGAELLRSAPKDRVCLWPVSRRVNKTGTGDDDPMLVDEVVA